MTEDEVKKMLFSIIFSACCVWILASYIGMWRKYNVLYDSYKALDFKYQELKVTVDKLKSVFFVK